MQQARIGSFWVPLVILGAVAGIVLAAMAEYRAYVVQGCQAALSLLCLIHVIQAVMQVRANHFAKAGFFVAASAAAGFVTMMLERKSTVLDFSPDVFLMAAPIVIVGLCLFSFAPARS